MEAQEIFDTVATHLFKQGRQSLHAGYDTMCAYRGADGAKCAVGVLIPDELYNDMMEGRTIWGLLDTSDNGLPEWLSANKELLGDLQHAHDCVGNWSGSAVMRRALNKIAGRNSLSADVLEGLAFPWESKEEV
jgi:hypothetical protein